MAVLLLTAGGLVVGQGSACACSCALGTEAEYWDHADLVFTGVVVALDQPLLANDGGSVEATFVVESVGKGAAGDRTTIRTSGSSASCGFDFGVGQRFTVYAQGGQTGLCSGNKLLGPAPEVKVDGAGPSAYVLVLGGAGVLLVAGVVVVLIRRRSAHDSAHDSVQDSA